MWLCKKKEGKRERPTVVCSAFIEKDDKYLIVFCPKFRVWRVPGGRAEIGETLEQTLIREMQEEIGITIENPVFLGFGQDIQHNFIDKTDKYRLIMYFHAKVNKEPAVNPEEAKEYKFVSLDELKRIENKEGALNDFFKRNPNLQL